MYNRVLSTRKSESNMSASMIGEAGETSSSGRRRRSDYIMVVDTETTGLPANRNASPRDYHSFNDCRMVQIAWAIYDTDGNLQFEECFIVRPSGYIIPESSTRIHGISHEQASIDGMDLGNILCLMSDTLEYVSTIVAHNIDFDNKVILSEMYRYIECNNRSDAIPATTLINTWIQKQKKCTMKMGTLSGQRWPKLINLYTRLFNSVPDVQLHRADADVRVCARIYFALIAAESEAASEHAANLV